MQTDLFNPRPDTTPAALNAAAQAASTSRGACGHVTAAPTIPGDCFLCMGGLPCLSPAECGIGAA